MSLDIITEAQESQPKRKKKSRKALYISLAVVGAMLLGVVGVGAYYLSSLNSALNTISRETSLVPEAQYENRPPATTTSAMNIMLLGSDSRGAGDQGRSDAIMWLHVSADRSQVYITSFTRDMWVDIPGYGKGKINAAYSYGGVPLQVKTIETLIGARIDHVAVIDFEGFINLTTILGGVTVNNPYASKYQNKVESYTWPKGDVTVAGAEALAFVRQRYELPTGAWGRAERQREVIGAIILQLTKPGVLANPAKFSELATAVAKTLKVDSGVTNELIYNTAMSLKLDGRKSIKLLQAPIVGPGSAGDQYIDVPNFDQLKELGTAMREDTMAAYVTKYPK